MKIGIVGTGAMGSVFGGLLCADGRDVTCYEVDERIVNSIREEGLRIDRPADDALVVDVPVTTDPGDLASVDVLFVFTKSFDTESALDDIEPVIDASTRVATLQNGVYNFDRIVERVSIDRAIGGYTYVGSNTIGPGHVRFMGPKPTVIGGADRETTDRLAEILDAAGLPTEAVDDPLPHIWKKQLWNVARKPISALCELRNGPQHEIEETRFIARKLIEEAVAIARAKGIEILSNDPVGDFLAPPSEDHYDKKSSILEDVENGVRTEIESINGAIVTYGDELGIDVPYNRAVTALVRGKERGYLGANPEPGE